MSLRTLVPLAFIVAISISQPSAANGIQSGEDIVQSECSACHAIGLTGNSPNPKSPPFRVIARKYPPENLMEALVEGIVTGHNEMPEFIFEPDEAHSIVEYLNSLR